MTEKFTINIIGNICSGKTTLIKKVKAETKGISYFAIDEYRKAFSDGSAHYDAYCWERMIADVERTDIAIVESSGVSPNYYKLCQLPDRNVINIVLNCNTLTCARRWKDRPKNGLGIAFAYSIEESLSYISRRLAIVDANVEIDGSNDEMTVFRHFMEFMRFDLVNIEEIQKTLTPERGN